MANKGNLISIVDVLKKREEWKYKRLRKRLERDGRRFEFEFEVEGRVFDLALFDAMVIVEFDGPDHRGPQLVVDVEKEKLASKHGFSVIRRKVKRGKAISVKELVGL